MKKYTLYPGCVMPTEQYAYEMSVREVLPLLDIDLVDLKGFSCCGEPLKSVNQMLALALSARNLAIAEKEGLDVTTSPPGFPQHLNLSESLDPTALIQQYYSLRDQIITGDPINFQKLSNLLTQAEELVNELTDNNSTDAN